MYVIEFQDETQPWIGTDATGRPGMTRCKWQFVSESTDAERFFSASKLEQARKYPRLADAEAAIAEIKKNHTTVGWMQFRAVSTLDATGGKPEPSAPPAPY